MTNKKKIKVVKGNKKQTVDMPCAKLFGDG